jgi:hypothetical protein
MVLCCIDDRSGITCDTRRTSHSLSGVIKWCFYAILCVWRKNKDTYACKAVRDSKIYFKKIFRSARSHLTFLSINAYRQVEGYTHRQAGRKTYKQQARRSDIVYRKKDTQER